MTDAALLYASRHALLTGTPTALSRAIAFLVDDYEATGHGFWWELVELNRKLILCGWVLLIEEAPQGRILAALLVSVAFLALHLFVKPLQR